MQLFYNGYEAATSIDDFLKRSPTARYLSVIYGELCFSEDFRGHFLCAYVDIHNTRILITEDVFFTHAVQGDVRLIGYIHPKNMKYSPRRKLNSKIGYDLSKKGYAIQKREDSDIKRITQQVFECSFHSKFKEIKDNTNRCYDSLEEYIDKLDTVNPTPDFLLDFSNNIIINDYDNPMCSPIGRTETRIQRYKKGDAMSRHFGADKDEPALFTSLNYNFPNDTVNGRELICGERSDFINYMNTIVDGTGSSYDHIDDNFIRDIAEIELNKDTTLYVSAFNPRFYHGVKELKDDTFVDTIIKDYFL